MSCDHRLGTLPCINKEPHAGGGRGCIHDAGNVDDRHFDGVRKPHAKGKARGR